MIQEQLQKSHIYKNKYGESVFQRTQKKRFPWRIFFHKNQIEEMQLQKKGLQSGPMVLTLPSVLTIFHVQTSVLPDLEEKDDKTQQSDWKD